MEDIRNYLIRITAAALVCGIVGSLVEKKGSVGVTLKTMCGIFMTLTLLSPLVSIRLAELPELITGSSLEADALITQGKEYSQDAMSDIIMRRTEAYILEKAESVGADIRVEVKLDTAQIPVPCGVRIVGSISPYGKDRLQQIIKEELGIPVEEQIWVN